MSTSVVLSVGSNCSMENVSNAVEWLSTFLESFVSSSLYRTPSICGYGSPYVNAVVSGKSPVDYGTLNQKLKEYEILCGRDEMCRRSSKVPVDIDIVIWDGNIVRERDYRHDFFQIGYMQISI